MEAASEPSPRKLFFSLPSPACGTQLRVFWPGLGPGEELGPSSIKSLTWTQEL